MFSYIKGNIEEIAEDFFILESNNMGYKIHSSYESLKKLKLKENIKIYTRVFLKDDEFAVYGFLSKEELKMFELLKTVSKVGNKVALGILSFDSLNNIKNYIVNEDVKNISKAQGVGKKTAERIILELKDKVESTFDIIDRMDMLKESENNDKIKDIKDALLNFGFEIYKINEVLKMVDISTSLEECIKKSLKLLSKM
ncbi:MAG: Holliday junction branch migration protein RuvA [Peptostreptococcaceae bacterium]|jgi:Holliday junction DNA helicase RuvA|nr:Holliday junction branch migration protein RuvA [Peptostreptococcaceae bacterium]